MACQRRLFLLSAVALAGCGFELRREPELQFRSLTLQGFKPGSPFAAELKRQLARTQVQLLEDPNKAELVLEAKRDERSKNAVVSTSAGQVREWQLKLNVDFLIRTPGMDVLLPRTELRILRDMNYTESQALAKEQEEASLYRAMQSEAVALLMRRLAAIRLPVN